MRQVEIEKHIQKTCRPLHQLSSKILKHFDAGDIHAFRIQIKKLRAFLRLLQFQPGQINKITITKKMKSFYGYVGIVRNMQLQQQKVAEYCKVKNENLPTGYIQELKNEIGYWKEQTLNLMADNNNFLTDEESIVMLLPDKLNKTSIKKFAEAVMQQIKEEVLHKKKDEVIHHIRKLLKDILYNWENVKEFAVRFPAIISTAEGLKAVTGLLGKFRDECTAIIHITTNDGTAQYNLKEKKILKQMELEWVKNSNQIRMEIYSILKVLF